MGFKEFTCDEDVWKVIDLLIDEVKSNNEKFDKQFDVASSIESQISFFACKNVLHKKEYQDDIARYLYCKDFGVQPYEGDYSKHPAKWIDKAFIIKHAIAKKERKLRDVRKNSNKV
tara:strand:+ start:315 stop:662 length:348 start_codon:yes stop_codon:yes gene_type:complete